MYERKTNVANANSQSLKTLPWEMGITFFLFFFVGSQACRFIAHCEFEHSHQIDLMEH